MTDEIERVEKIMKRSQNSKNSGKSTTHDESSLSRTSSKKDDMIDARKALKDSKHPITRICLTGGPCAGKTTALATLSVVLQ